MLGKTKEHWRESGHSQPITPFGIDDIECETPRNPKSYAYMRINLTRALLPDRIRELFFGFADDGLWNMEKRICG